MIHRMHNLKTRVKSFLLLSLLIIGTIPASLLQISTSRAVNYSNFQPGYIISDAIFTNTGTMNITAIQNFLNSKVTSCDTNGQQLSEYGGPDLNSDGKVQRWEWGKQYYNQTKFTCLRNYTEGGKSAARIIYETAQTYNINPQVLIVLLQKEQALVTDTWPLNVQYRTATGYGCPDTAACDTQYYGFTNQVRWAATMFRAIMTDSPTWYTPYELGNNSIPWHPNTRSCGYSTVNIENRATQALYNYTPYRPNQAALNAGYGSGDSCSSYGNRNFFAYFTDWFGITTDISYSSLDDPRWMRLKNNTYKNDLRTGDTTGVELSAGLQIYFPDKVMINGTWYLRTAYDKQNGNLYGIDLGDLEEIPVEAIASTWMSTTRDTRKVDPLRNITYETVPSMTAVKVVDRITVNGYDYYRTEWENGKNRQRYIPAADLEALKYYTMTKPRILYVPSNIDKIDLLTGAVVSRVPAGSYVTFGERITLDNTLYVQANSDNGTNAVIRFDQLSEYSGTVKYTPMTVPRIMKLVGDTYKKTIPGIEDTGPLLLDGREIEFEEKVILDGVLYLRTKYDTGRVNHFGIPFTDLEEL